MISRVIQVHVRVAEGRRRGRGRGGSWGALEESGRERGHGGTPVAGEQVRVARVKSSVGVSERGSGGGVHGALAQGVLAVLDDRGMGGERHAIHGIRGAGEPRASVGVSLDSI